MIRAKIEQAVGILNELDIDLWMIFVRESASLHDPCIDLVVGGNVTWQTAFLITRSGERIAILGSLDKAAHEMLGHYTEIIPYVKGIGEPLRDTLARLDPRRIAVNFSTDDELADGLSHGMYLLLQNTLRGTPYGERLVSSEGIVSRLRSRKLEPELANITRACAETVDLFAQLHKRLKVGMTEKADRRRDGGDHGGQGPGAGVGPRTLPGSLHRARVGGRPRGPDRPAHGARAPDERRLRHARSRGFARTCSAPGTACAPARPRRPRS